MNIVTLDNITKSYTERKLFDKASFYLQEGEKIGVIGINGTGKSTLLKMIAGLTQPEDGQIIKSNNLVVGYLPQNPTFQDQHSVLESVLEGNITKENQWTLESTAKAMLMQLGVSDFNQPTKQLSGGQKKRLALVSTLLSPADILVMDEPTNHLDNQMAQWLEDYLKKWNGSLVMVTHDRYFLDEVSNKIIEIDQGKIYSYETNYSGFVALKAERMDMAVASQRKRQSILKVELQWMQRGARARSTKQKARIERYEEMKNQSGPIADGKVELSSISSRLGKSTIELSHITKAYDRPLITDFSYLFLHQDRIGFIGENGCGKTTLMKIIANKMLPDSGTISIGQTVKISYYAQEIQTSEYGDPNDKVIDYIRKTAEYVQTKDGPVSASAMLERFLFLPSMQYTQVSRLSGGEQRRLQLLRILMDAPNVLILDEPTNDLDIATLTILEDYLDTFEGIVICVSHDRYFLDRTMNRIFAFTQTGHLKQYEGGYSDYVLKREAEIEKEMQNNTNNNNNNNNNNKKNSNNHSSDNELNQSIKSTKVKNRKLKFSYQEQIDYDTIESQLESLEQTIKEIDIQMANCATDFVHLNELTKQKEEHQQLLDEKMNRWMYLEDLASKIENS